MPIKNVPVCPFCSKDMAKTKDILEDVLIPKGLAIIPRDPSKATSPGDLRDLRGITDYIYFHVWECEGCGFVALWKGNPR